MWDVAVGVACVAPSVQRVTAMSCAGSHLHDNWVVVLRCLSRWALVTQLASGAPTDLSLFSSVDPQQKHDLKKSWWQGARARQSQDGSPKPPMQPGTLIDAGLSLGDDFMNKAPSPGVQCLLPCGNTLMRGLQHRCLLEGCTMQNAARRICRIVGRPDAQCVTIALTATLACRGDGCGGGGSACPGV